MGFWGFGVLKRLQSLTRGILHATIGFAELDSSAQDGSLRSGHPYVGCIAMDQGTFVSGGACSGFVMTASELTDSLTMVKDKIMAKSATSDWKFDEQEFPEI